MSSVLATTGAADFDFSISNPEIIGRNSFAYDLSAHGTVATNTRLSVGIIASIHPDSRNGYLYCNFVFPIPQPGETLRVTNDYFAIPDIAQYLHVEINTGDYLVPEENRSDNKLVIPLDHRIDLRPRLLIPQTVHSQARARLRWEVENLGPGIAQFPHVDFITMSYTNPAVPGPGINAEQRSLGELEITPERVGSGGIYSREVEVTIPRINAGIHLLQLRVDATNLRAEGSETNNSIAIPIEVLNPDLELLSFEMPERTSALVLQKIIWRVRNNGPGRVETNWPNYLRFRSLSQEHVWGLAFDSPVISLAAGESRTFTNALEIESIAQGVYDVAFVTNPENAFNSLAETNRTNNNLTNRVNIPGPFFRMTRFELPPAHDVNQYTNSVIWEVTNVGNLPGSGEIDFFTSEDTALDIYEDRTSLVGSFPVLQPGQSYLTTNILTVWPVPGERANIIAVVQNKLNWYPWITQNLGTNFSSIFLIKPDVVIEIVNAPLQLDAYEEFDVVWRVRNVGGTPFSSVVYIYQMGETNAPITDNRYGSIVHYMQWVQPGEVAVFTNRLHFKMGFPGSNFLVVAADNTVANTNNIVAIQPIHIRLPDLVPLTLDFPNPIVSTGLLEIAWSVTNNGPHIPHFLPVQDAVYLNGDNRYIPINDFEGPNFYNRAVKIFAELQDGEHIITLHVDGHHFYTNWVVEANEANNIISKTIVVRNPEIEASHLRTPRAEVPGSILNVAWKVVNNGLGIPPFGLKSTLYLSRSNVITRDAVQVFSQIHTQTFSLGIPHEFSQAAVVPNLSPDDFFLILRVESAIGWFVEKDYGNNQQVRPFAIVENLEQNPYLEIEMLPDKLRLSWPFATSNYILQASSDLITWRSRDDAVTTNGAQMTVEIFDSPSALFSRLGRE